MRILYVTSAFPFPLTSGYLRHYFLIRELSRRRHAITLLAVAGARFAPEHAEALEGYAERVLAFPSGRGGQGRVGRAVLRAGALVGGPAVDVAVRGMRDSLRRLLAEERFDVVLLAGKRAFSAIEEVREVPVVADMCDAASMRLRRSLRYEPPERLLLSALDYADARRVERMVARRADRLVFASARDRDALVGGEGRAAEGRAVLIPNGVDLDFWRRRTPELGQKTIVFTGVMSYPPNADAALHLINDILPLAQHSVPEARLLLVGRNPSRRLLRAARRPGVELTGYVEDMRPFLERATVFAAPLRFAAGIQNKVLEAMAMEVPAVVSPLVVEGLVSAKGERPPLHVASDAGEFADLLCRELRTRGGDAAPDADARRFVATHFQWSRSAEVLEEVLRSAASGASREPGACSPSR